MRQAFRFDYARSVVAHVLFHQNHKTSPQGDDLFLLAKQMASLPTLPPSIRPRPLLIAELSLRSSWMPAVPNLA